MNTPALQQLPEQAANLVGALARGARQLAERRVVPYPFISGLPPYGYAMRSAKVRHSFDLIASGERSFLFGLITRRDADQIVSRIRLDMALHPAMETPLPLTTVSRLVLPKGIRADRDGIGFALSGRAMVVAAGPAGASWNRDVSWTYHPPDGPARDIDTRRPSLSVLLGLLTVLSQLGSPATDGREVALTVASTSSDPIVHATLEVPHALIGAFQSIGQRLADLGWPSGSVAGLPMAGLAVATASAVVEFVLDRDNLPAAIDARGEFLISIALMLAVEFSDANVAIVRTRLGIPDFLTDGPVFDAFGRALSDDADALATRLADNATRVVNMLRRPHNLHLVMRYRRNAAFDDDLVVLRDTARAGTGGVLVLTVPARVIGGADNPSIELRSRDARLLFHGNTSDDVPIDLRRAAVPLWERLGRTARVLQAWTQS